MEGQTPREGTPVKKEGRRALLPGLILVCIGLVLLLSSLEIIDVTWQSFWPLLLLGMGIVMEWEYFAGGGKRPEMLVPAGILITISILFLICAFYGWDRMSLLWPFFILAPALGLFQLYLFGERKRALLFPVAILTVLGATFLAANLGFSGAPRILAPAAMIAIGLYLLLRK
ncbi:MAG: LiaI-LiaF-like domain-containing protein [Bacillota bacterium]